MKDVLKEAYKIHLESSYSNSTQRLEPVELSTRKLARIIQPTKTPYNKSDRIYAFSSNPKELAYELSKCSGAFTYSKGYNAEDIFLYRTCRQCRKVLDTYHVSNKDNICKECLKSKETRIEKTIEINDFETESKIFSIGSGIVDTAEQIYRRKDEDSDIGRIAYRILENTMGGEKHNKRSLIGYVAAMHYLHPTFDLKRESISSEPFEWVDEQNIQVESRFEDQMIDCVVSSRDSSIGVESGHRLDTPYLEERCRKLASKGEVMSMLQIPKTFYSQARHVKIVTPKTIEQTVKYTEKPSEIKRNLSNPTHENIEEGKIKDIIDTESIREKAFEKHR